MLLEGVEMGDKCDPPLPGEAHSSSDRDRFVYGHGKLPGYSVFSDMSQTARQPIFCTACGEKLEDFCFSPEAKDLEALRAHAFRCYLEMRRLGGMCAALYIADDAHPAQPGDATPPAQQPGDPADVKAQPADGAPLTHQTPDEETLRQAILARIARYEDSSSEGSASGRGPVA